MWTCLIFSGDIKDLVWSLIIIRIKAFSVFLRISLSPKLMSFEFRQKLRFWKSIGRKGQCGLSLLSISPTARVFSDKFPSTSGKRWRFEKGKSNVFPSLDKLRKIGNLLNQLGLLFISSRHSEELLMTFRLINNLVEFSKKSFLLAKSTFLLFNHTETKPTTLIMNAPSLLYL